VRGSRGRNGKIAPRKGRRRLGSVLFVIGILSVLGTTFIVGAFAGRLSVSASARSDDRSAKPAAPSPPQLTFYRELTAPLTPPPPPAPPRPHKDKAAPPPAETPKRADKPAPTPVPSPAASPATSDPGNRRADGSRYTVQVGSYTVRDQAEALRARLGASGHEAYVTEGEANGSTRYRVRVGSFATMEEARQAAVRLGSEARVATYVTTR
jgi:cell division protein FtsN